jgi:predicted PurR-regulated permease PerM
MELTNAGNATISRFGGLQKEREPLSSEPSTQKRIGAVLFYGIAILVGYLTYRVFQIFLAPLAWAGVLAVVVFPTYARLAQRWGPNKAALATTVGVTLILIVPTIFLMKAFVQEAVNAVQSVQFEAQSGHYAWLTHFWEHLQSRFPRLFPADLWGALHRYIEEAARYVAQRLGSILEHTAEFLLDLAFTILALFYFFRDGRSIVSRLRHVLPFDSDQRARMLTDARDMIFATVIASLLSAALHGAVGGLAFALTGIRAPIFWGVLMGVCSLIPFIGTALVWAPLSISLILGGHLARGIVLAIVCSLVVGMVDNFVRPLLISERASMNMLLVFIGVLGGISVFGLLGVILGPIIIAISATLLEFYMPHSPAGNTGPKPGGKKKQAVLE